VEAWRDTRRWPVAVASLDTLSTTATVARSPLASRQRAKAFSEANAQGLWALNSPLHFAYGRTIVCANTLRQADGVVTAKYCGARWCIVCARIRSAKSAARYLPHVERWGTHARFVTLTVPNVERLALKVTVREMIAAVKLIALAIRRTDGLTFEAIRKLEVTPEQFSASAKGAKRAGFFHPHFHLLVNGEAQAQALVRRWLVRFPGALSVAQNISPLDGRQGAARELFKYSTKLVTKLDGRHTAIPAAMQDVIYRALSGLRTWQPMGIKAADPVQLAAVTLARAVYTAAAREAAAAARAADAAAARAAARVPDAAATARATARAAIARATAATADVAFDAYEAARAGETAEEREQRLDVFTRAEKRAADIVTWEWSTVLLDWVDFKTGETLGVELPPSLAQLVANVRHDAGGLPP
jgi:hypothetical protein